MPEIYSHVTSPRPSPPLPSPSPSPLHPHPSPLAGGAAARRTLPSYHPSQEELPPVDTKATLHDAPDTVRFGDQLPEVERTDYYYRPLLGAVPQLEVPSMLTSNLTPTPTPTLTPTPTPTPT